MARFLSFALAACSLTLFVTVTGCSSGDFSTASADPDAGDASFGDGTIDDVSDARVDTDPPDSAPPPCASPPCSCADPKPTRCGAACVDTKTDVDHCGSCVESCNKVDHGTTACAGSSCTLACDPSYHVCGKDCLKNTSLGSCGTSSCSPCPAPGKNASATCDGLKCGVACYAGFADCNGGTDGCEVDITLNANCGACGIVCSGATPYCAPKAGGGYACSGGCSGSTTLCGGVCVDTTTSPTNCGGCGNTCPVVPHARRTCSSSACGFICDTGYHACDGACVPDDAVTSCGTASCTACSTPPHSAATCDAIKCGYACNPGFRDCNGLPGDGCEADLGSPVTCGSCGSTCPIPPHGTATCSGGICGFTCTAPWIALGDRCALFGGAYEINAKSCGAGTTTCAHPNPFAKDCACPPGFVAEHTGASLECDETLRNDFVLCNAPSVTGATFPTGIDWGGAYSQRAISCDPVTDCFTKNPYTGACSCPAGTTPVSFDVEDTSPDIGCVITTGGPPYGPSAFDAIAAGGSEMTKLVFCGPASSSTSLITFFGAFETADDGTCLVKNPLTSACSCPGGGAGRVRNLRVMYAPGKAGFVSYCVPG